MTTQRPLFSILIPTYNRAHLVGTAIRSVLLQEYPDVEIVVSDNHSNDDTSEVVRSFNDDRVRLVRPEAHCPLPQNWETTRRHARGRLLLVLSDDDALTHDSLRLAAEVAVRYPDTALVGLQAEYFSANFPGAQRNVLNHLRGTGTVTLRNADWFLSGLFRFKWPRDTHPSGWFWPRRVVERVVERCGSFWATNGAELFAIPAGLAVDPKLVTVDSHFGVKGRAPESIGTKMYFTNPGEDAVEELLADTEKRSALSPIEGFSYANLYSEGLWAARAAYIAELGHHPRDIAAYVDYLYREMQRRKAMGISFGGTERQVQILADAFGVRSSPKRSRALVDRVHHGVRRRVRPATFSVHGEQAGFADMLGAATYVSAQDQKFRQ